MKYDIPPVSTSVHVFTFRLPDYYSIFCLNFSSMSRRVNNFAHRFSSSFLSFTIV